jgi:formate dehydrogenase assembly factor FdhD
MPQILIASMASRGSIAARPSARRTLISAALGRAKRYQRHFPGHRGDDGAALQQHDGQVAVIRADVGQARA